MRFLLPLPLLIILVVAYTHATEENDKTIIAFDNYPETLVIYEGKHDIVDIMVPLNSISEQDISESDRKELFHIKKYLMIFFVEADINNGRRQDQGIYMYRDGKVTKIMDKGRALAASADDSDCVFIGAKDGLYIYNPHTQTADKYGNFNDSIKDMAKEQNTDAIYILTDDRDLYKVYDAATKQMKIDDIVDAEQIMIDYSNNLYYYGKDKKPYVRRVDGEIKKIEGLPEVIKEISLLRPMLFNSEEVSAMIDNEIYALHSNGTSEFEHLEFMPGAKPSAYSTETGILHYLGYKKKIYEYDLVALSWE